MLLVGCKNGVNGNLIVSLGMLVYKVVILFDVDVKVLFNNVCK